MREVFDGRSEGRCVGDRELNKLEKGDRETIKVRDRKGERDGVTPKV